MGDRIEDKIENRIDRREEDRIEDRIGDGIEKIGQGSWFGYFREQRDGSLGVVFYQFWTWGFRGFLYFFVDFQVELGIKGVEFKGIEFSRGELFLIYVFTVLLVFQGGAVIKVIFLIFVSLRRKEICLERLIVLFELYGLRVGFLNFKFLI